MRRRPGATACVVAVIAACAVWTAVSTTGCGSADQASAVREVAPSNLGRMRTLVAAIGAGVLDSAGRAMGDTVVLDVDSSDAAWVARTEIAGVLGRSGRTVVTVDRSSDHSSADRSPGAGSRWNVRGVTLRAEYRDVRKPGLFSGAVVDRVVSASLSNELTRDGIVLHAGASAASATDTVDEGGIAELEAGSPESSRGTVPPMETFDRFIEPLVIIGAAGVAIFLFFQVRS